MLQVMRDKCTATPFLASRALIRRAHRVLPSYRFLKSQAGVAVCVCACAYDDLKA